MPHASHGGGDESVGGFRLELVIAVLLGCSRLSVGQLVNVRYFS
jgi:hypothetical protein